MAFFLPLLFVGGVGAGAAEGGIAIKNTIEWNKKKICSSSPQKPPPKNDTGLIENCLACSKNNYSACARLGRNTLESLSNLPMSNTKSRRIYKGLAKGQSLQIGDMLVSADYQYVMFLAPKDKDGNGVLLFYNGLIQNPKNDTSWYDTTLSTPFYQGMITGNKSTFRGSSSDQSAVVTNWGAQIVMFQKNKSMGEIVFYNAEMSTDESTSKDATELQVITARQALERQGWTLDSYTFVLPGSFVPINSTNSSVIYGPTDDEVANRLNLKQLAAAIIKYQKDPDVYKNYDTTKLSIMGLNPWMAKGKDGARYLFKFSDGGSTVYWSTDTFTGWVPSQSANANISGTPPNTKWSVEAAKQKSFWRVHSWTAFYLSAQYYVNTPGSEINIPRFASGTYFGSNVLDPAKILKATVPTGVDKNATFETCKDLDEMTIPQCKDNAYDCVSDNNTPYACYTNKANFCPKGYTKSDVTCQLSGATYNMCRRNKTYTQLHSSDNKFECCSGVNMNGTENMNGSVNCPSGYCGKFSGNEANSCSTFLTSYCKGKASEYPKYKGKTMSKQDVTELTNTATASFTSDTNVRKHYTFLSDVYPGCGCTDYPLIQIAKTAHNLSVKTAGGDTITANFASTPECWFAPCQKANKTSSLKQNNCTTAFCASVQANVEKGNNLVNSNNCTATAKNIIIAPTITPAPSTPTSKPASATPASTTPTSKPASASTTTPASSKTTSKKSPYTKYFIYGGVGLGTLFIILMLVLIFRS